VRTLVKLMGDTYPELREREEFVTSVIRDEEESFSKTIDKGIVMFKKRCDLLGPDGRVFLGKDAHFLYTLMGFPVDLTELMYEERGLTWTSPSTTPRWRRSRTRADGSMRRRCWRDPARTCVSWPSRRCTL
jgi:alanyl-tRNA synthetase